MNKNLAEKGFSLTSVLVASALLGVVALGVMQVMKNIGQGQNFAKTVADEMELRTEIKMLLDEERFCRVSLAGNGPIGTPTVPVTFQKVNIDQDGEGLDLELWLSDQAGLNRTQKKFSATDPAKIKYGKLKILSMKLVMNNQTGINYSVSPYHMDMGEIQIQVEKNVSETQTRVIPMKFPVMVSMSTAAGGNTTLLSCTRLDANKPRVASGQNVVGPNGVTNEAVIDLAAHGFSLTGTDPHIIVSEHDYNYVAAEGNTMDASYCGFTKVSKLVFRVSCWASTNSSDSAVQSSFDWLAIQN